MPHIWRCTHFKLRTALVFFLTGQKRQSGKHCKDDAGVNTICNILCGWHQVQLLTVFSRVHGGNYTGRDKSGGEACIWGNVGSIWPGRPPSLRLSVDSGWITPASVSLVRSLKTPAGPPPPAMTTRLTCYKCDAYVCKAHSNLIVQCHSCVWTHTETHTHTDTHTYIQRERERVMTIHVDFVWWKYCLQN